MRQTHTQHFPRRTRLLWSFVCFACLGAAPLLQAQQYLGTTRQTPPAPEEGQREIRIHFPLDKAVLLENYLQNAATLRLLDSLVQAGYLEHTDTLHVVSFSSPEGRQAYNEALAGRRAQAFSAYLTERYPELSGRLIAEPSGESWQELRLAVEKDARLSETTRAALLRIIDSDVRPDEKERQLKRQPAYKQLYAAHFKTLRYAFIRVNDWTEAPLRDHLAQVPSPAPVLSVPITVPAPVYTRPQRRPTTTRQRNLLFAAKTNLLYDAVSALNIEVEVPLGHHLSVLAEDVFPWWESGNKYCFQLWEMGAEARWWFKSWPRYSTDKLQGWFAGVYGMSAKYDFQWDRDLNLQGEYWSAGLSAGYALPVGRHKRMNLEFSLAAGPLHTQYRHYQPTRDYEKLIRDPYNAGIGFKTGQWYVGPTKAKVSLVVPLYHTKKEVRHE